MSFKDFINNMRLSAGMAKCSDYKELIELVIDNEASRSQEVYLNRHMKMCLQCLDKFNVDRELKKAIKLRLQNKKVPAGLADSIREKINNSV